jgi:predicted AlkP superfamily phosphohydrolase/phosphomutase
VNWSKTKAFTTIRSTGEGVSVNLAGREPDGIVDPADFEKVRDQVMDALSSFVDPKTGRNPVKAIPGMPTGSEESNVSDTEADEMEEHLRGLGYLE